VADKINRVIVLMLENRSFDHVIGGLKDIPELEGIPDPPAVNSFNNRDYRQEPGAARFLKFDPHHEHEHVVVQLEDGNKGFVKDYAQSYPRANATNDLPEVMRYHADGKLPAIHELAKNFTVCNHWHASVPGPTWCNRLFALSGTSLGRVAMPDGIMSLNLHWYNQPTLFDRLNEKNIPWKVYFGDAPLSFLFVHQWEKENIARHRTMSEFYRDIARHPQDPKEDGLPQFSFIEPQYFQPGATDAHPPHDIFAADALVGSVYNAIRANKKLWEEVLLVVAFDEHGGFYDHVTPPATVPPDFHQEEYDFKQLGVRVPVILISPWVAKGICDTPMDHTSLLKYLQEKWGLGPLGHRTEVASTFTNALHSDENQRNDALPDGVAHSIVPLEHADAQPPNFEKLTSNQHALLALSHVLESMAGEEASVIASRARSILSHAQSQIDTAMDRFESFIGIKKARAS
jgi:phospholipase C